MARGGARSGAGRKKGHYVPGSRAEQRAFKRQAVREAVELAKAEGETPLEYMLRVMRTSGDPKRCDAMAIAAAPYLHPRLSNATVTMQDKRGLADIDTAELIAALRASGDPGPLPH
jgi:hypothetical protein